MSTLPNILPAANTDSFNDGREMIFPGAAQKNGDAFDHLMSRAVSPSANNANPPVETSAPEKNAGENFLSEPKNSQSSAPTSSKNRAKTTGGNSESGKNSSAPFETNAAAVNPENVLIQIVASILPHAEISVAVSKTAASQSAEIFTALPEVKNQSQAETKTNPAIKVAGQGKITAQVQALAGEKTNSTDSEIAELTAANPQALPLAKDIPDDLTPKLADKLFVPAAPTEFSVSSDLKEKVAVQAEPEVNGTSAAQQDAPMKKTENPNKTSSPTGKILPGAAVSVARENNLPSRENFYAAALSRAGQMAANVTVNSSASNSANDTAPFSADAAGLIGDAATVDFRARALERVQDMIVQHATRLSDSGNDLLQVVIKPGAGTQLSLELRQRGDGVEATAVLQRGDFNHLNQQWPALQQQLEHRGIRLAPLATDGNFVNNGENNFQQKQNQFTEPDSFPVGAFAEIAPPGLITGAFAQSDARAMTHHGWESWA
jgi:hypothetical protein